MSRREEAKAFNRARIRAAAEGIIRTQGMERLTMRHLAQQAGVSLRTPYNLFGSKTGVLISLMEEAEFQLSPDSEEDDGRLVLERMLASLDGIETFFGKDEDYFRNIYASIMTSDHWETRRTAFARSLSLPLHHLQNAQEHGELQPDTDIQSLARHLSVELLAVLGMWGSGFFPNRESIDHVRQSWCASLLQHCTEKPRPALTSVYLAAMKGPKG